MDDIPDGPWRATCGEVVMPGLNGWLLPSLPLPKPLNRPAFGLLAFADALQQLSLPTVSP